MIKILLQYTAKEFLKIGQRLPKSRVACFDSHHYNFFEAAWTVK